MGLAQELNSYWLLALVVVAFLAGYVDAIAGGGGVVLIPALLFAGVPAVSAMAVNKIVAIAGTTLAVVKYALAKQVYWRLVFWSLLPCLAASFLGGKLALLLSDKVLVWMILLCIPVALYFVLTNRKSQTNETGSKYTRAGWVLSPIGFYDGLIGPGTGTYMTIAMRRFLSMDYLRATATTKPLNLVTNVGAAVAFLLAGKVIWALAIPMLLANAAGAWVGSHFAIKNGDAFIRRMLVIVLVIMLTANVIKLIVS